MKRLGALMLVLGIVAILAGCNTVQGVGKDVSSAGRAIERSSGK